MEIAYSLESTGGEVVSAAYDDVISVVAPSESLPYWMFKRPSEDGNITAVFISSRIVRVFNMTGEEEEDGTTRQDQVPDMLRQHRDG